MQTSPGKASLALGAVCPNALQHFREKVIWAWASWLADLSHHAETSYLSSIPSPYAHPFFRTILHHATLCCVNVCVWVWHVHGHLWTRWNRSLAIRKHNSNRKAGACLSVEKVRSKVCTFYATSVGSFACCAPSSVRTTGSWVVWLTILVYVCGNVMPYGGRYIFISTCVKCKIQ